ncbi:MAG: class I SAM-dependent methyltransferase [Longimicrobiales bacterium]
MVEIYDIDRYYERSHPLIRWVESRRLAALVELAQARAGERLLEVGCGGGHVLEQFPGLDRTGVDLSAGMLKRARRRVGPSVRLIQSQAERLPFQSGSFDVVVCTEVLEHILNPPEVIRELMRVAKPGGRVIVSIPCEANIDRAKRLLRRIPGLRRLLHTLADDGNEWHLLEFNLERLRDVAVLAGAEVIRLRGVPVPIAPIRYVASLAPAPNDGS